MPGHPTQTYSGSGIDVSFSLLRYVESPEASPPELALNFIFPFSLVKFTGSLFDTMISLIVIWFWFVIISLYILNLIRKGRKYPINRRLVAINRKWYFQLGIRDWGLGIGDWGLGIGNFPIFTSS